MDDNKAKSGKRSNALKSINNSVIMWAAFFTFSILVYYFLSSADFSFVMTYGSLSRMFGFGILNFKTFKTKKATVISVKTLQLYCITFACRLTSIIRHEGYLPYDKSGDWLYHVIEFMSLAFVATAMWGCLVPFKKSYQVEFDKFGEMHVPPGFGSVYLIIPCLALAIFIHPGLNQDFLSDVSWTFAMYLESVALVPQLYMFQRQNTGIVELLTAHFVAALGFGRVLEFTFWLYSYHELAHKSGSNYAGYLALISQFCQVLLMCDFFWYYYVAVKNATPLVLPSHNSLGVV
jgi:ER lumen protein retaining receptor